MKTDNIKYEYCIFIKSAIKGVYDKKTSEKKFAFDFLKFSKPKKDYLINKGVAEVVQSWKLIGKHRVKTLHTGLFNLGDGVYIGNNINEKGKKDFILLYYEIENLQIHFFLIKNRNPKNKTGFAFSLIDLLKESNFINY